MKIITNFASVLLNKLIKKGGGIGPMKPWQPTISPSADGLENRCQILS